MKLLSYNINGIRSAAKKGLIDYLQHENADIVALQEVKALREQLDFQLPEGYEVFWNAAERKGYSGTAVLSKSHPVSVVYGLGDFDENKEGRVITLEYDNFYFVAVYTPNSKAELARLDYRQKWDWEFYKHISSLAKKHPVIVCGDLNVAYSEIDLKNPDVNHFNPGFSDEERSGFGYILDHGFVDTFRHLYPQKVEYSWYSYRNFAREKNVGWRIDYFLVSEDIVSAIKDSKIVQSEYYSDHMPIILECELPC